MKCPACQREMRKGYLVDRQSPVQWIPEDGKPPLFKGTLADGAIQLGSGSYWKNYKADSYYCPFCHFVITPVK